MSLADYLELIRQRIRLVIALGLATTLLALALSVIQGPLYSATARIHVLGPAPGSAAINNLAQQLAGVSDTGTEGEIIRSTQVASRVRSALHLAGSDADVIDRITVTAVPNTAILETTATSGTPEVATALANAFADQYLALRRSQTLAALTETRDTAAATEAKDSDQVAALAQQLTKVSPNSADYATLKVKLEATAADLQTSQALLTSLADISSVATGFGQVIERAEQTTTVRQSSPLKNAVFGALLGLPVGIAAALLTDTLSPRIRSRAQAEAQAEAPVLGTTPLIPEVVDDSRAAVRRVEGDPLGEPAEAYRAIAHTLRRATEKTGAATVLVTSPNPGEGRSTTAAALGLVLSETGLPVTLVDADLRHPDLHRVLASTAGPGLSDMLVDAVPLADISQQIRPTLTFIPGGSRTERPDLTIGRRSVMSAVLRRLVDPAGAGAVAEDRHLVLLTASPVGTASEVLELAGTVDAVVLVARWNLTAKEDLAHAAELVRRSGGTLLGVVLVGVPQRHNLLSGWGRAIVPSAQVATGPVPG